MVSTSIDDAHLLADEWDEVPVQGVSAIFTSSAWCLSAWEQFHDRETPLLIAVRDDAGDLVGVLPLSTTSDGQVTWPASPLGDEHDIRIDPGVATEATVRRLLTGVHQGGRSSRNVALPDVRPDGTLARHAHSEVGCPAPILPLATPDTEFGALASIPGWSRKRRRSLRSSRRKLDELGEVTVRSIASPEVLALRVPEFISGRLAAWENRGRLDELPAMDRHEAMPAFLTCAAERLATKGQCDLLQLCLDEEPIAQSLYFLTDTAWHLYMSTYAPSMAWGSPSHLLLADAAARAIGDGIHVVELGRGDEPYKLDHGAERRNLCNIVLESRSNVPGTPAGTFQA